MVDARREFGDRRKQPLGRDVLQLAAMRVRRRGAAGEHDHRLRADKSFGDAGDEIGRAGARRHQTNAGLAGELGVGERHVRGAVLVAHAIERDVVGVIERVEDADHVTARQAEHDAHIFRAQRLNDRAGGGHCRHCLFPPCHGFLASASPTPRRTENRRSGDCASVRSS